MIGAIIGDIVGSRFEKRNHKSKDFDLFDIKCRPTDDSIMSLAIANAIMECNDNYEILPDLAVKSMQTIGRKYKNAGYGSSFQKWIWDDNPKPYNSFGNGSAMRVSPCGYAANSISEAKELAAAVTKVTHNHPEGLKGAEAIAVAVYLAKTGKSKEVIRDYICEKYYDLDFTINEKRDSYKFDVSCQSSVPVALEAFLESTGFEDAIRTAVSVGGDSDTIACMTGAVAEAFYGIPKDIIYDVIDYLDSQEMEILYYFEKKFPSKMEDDIEISVFDYLDDAVDKVIPAGTIIETDPNHQGDLVYGFVDQEVMIPDFSSFDIKDSDKLDPMEMISHMGKDAHKFAKKASRGIASAVKFAKNNIDAVAKQAEANKEYCYEIMPSDREDTEDIIRVVEQLKADKYVTYIGIYKGDMRGYVFLKEKELNDVGKHLMVNDELILKLRKTDKRTADKIKQLMK